MCRSGAVVCSSLSCYVVVYVLCYIRGFRALGVGRSLEYDGPNIPPVDEATFELTGLIPLFDPPRHDSGDVIRKCVTLPVSFLVP